MEAEYGFQTKQQLNDCILRFAWSEYPLPPVHRSCRDGDTLSLTYLTVQGDRLEVFRSINGKDHFLLWTPAHWAAYFGQVSLGIKPKNKTESVYKCNAEGRSMPESSSYVFFFCLPSQNASKPAFCLFLPSGCGSKFKTFVGVYYKTSQPFHGEIDCYVSHRLRGQQMNWRQNTRLNLFSIWLTLERGRKMRYWTEGPDLNMRVEERDINLLKFRYFTFRVIAWTPVEFPV